VLAAGPENAPTANVGAARRAMGEARRVPRKPPISRPGAPEQIFGRESQDDNGACG